jgi:C-terminal processing protease CtpA/Prc
MTFDAARLTIAATDRTEPEARRVAFEALRLHLAQTYPFFGLEGKPKQAFDLKPDPANADSTAQLNRTLVAPRDIHVWYDDGGNRVYPGPRNTSPPNYNVYAVRARLDTVLLEKRNRLIGRMGDIGYAGIGSFTSAEFEGVEAALDKLADARALILDLRFNNGGDERLAQRVAQRFALAPTVYALQQARDPFDQSKFVDTGSRKIGPGASPDGRPVIVLQGPHCVSSGEGFLMMMRAIGGKVRTVGLPSRGASGNPKPFQLLPDLVVYSSTWRSLLPDGTPTEGVGVPPMERFEAPKEAYLKGDPTLEHALRLLAK